MLMTWYMMNEENEKQLKREREEGEDRRGVGGREGEVERWSKQKRRLSRGNGNCNYYDS